MDPAFPQTRDERLEKLNDERAALKDALAWTDDALRETLPILREGAVSGMVPLADTQRVLAIVQRAIEINNGGTHAASISAAPDLLHTLRGLIAGIERAAAAGIDTSGYIGVGKALAAIRKAEGRRCP